MPGYFVTIEPDECRRLLGAGVVGRVAWVSPTAGLQVLPVNYTVVGESIVFAVAPGSVLHELAEPRDVAFQVDDLDPETATGWAILVQGRSAAHTASDALANLPWAPGPRTVAVAIEPVALSGRSVSADEA